VLLISIDTLRADRLGLHGYERDTTPYLDELAAESVAFLDMYSNSPKTASSHMSLFTSLHPTVHKVRNQSARLGLESPSLAHNRLTLPQVLNRNGYWNACVAGGGNINPQMGFSRGFQKRFESALWDIRTIADRTLSRVDEARQTDQPHFLFMHSYQVHGPYLPPREFEKRFAPTPRTVLGPRVALYRNLPFKEQWKAMNRGPGGDESLAFWSGKEDFGEKEASYLSDLYDGEVAFTDAELGRLIAELRERDALDDMILVILSDHGEEFFEHGQFEHDQLYREHLHVPCIIRLPGGHLGGTRVEGMVSLMDVMPTLLELLEIEGPATMQGRSLVSGMAAGRLESRPVLSERVMFPDDYKASLRTDASSVTFHARDGGLEAFDLVGDPDESTDVYNSSSFGRNAGKRLHQSLLRAFLDRDILDEIDAGGTIKVDADQLEELRQLGYLGAEGEEVQMDVTGTPLESWPDEDV
jgi:arylsulfatase A-like enzyme